MRFQKMRSSKFFMFFILTILVWENFSPYQAVAAKADMSVIQFLKGRMDAYGKPVIVTSAVGKIYDRGTVNGDVLWTDVGVAVIAHYNGEDINAIIDRANVNLSIISYMGVKPYLKGTVQFSYGGAPLFYVVDSFSRKCMIELEEPKDNKLDKEKVYLFVNEDVSTDFACTLLAWSFAANNYWFRQSSQRKELVILTQEK